MKTKIAVFVSGGGTNLQALIDAQGTVLVSGEIVLVVSNNADAYALERAKKAGITKEVVLKKVCGSQSAFEEKMKQILFAHGCSCCYCLRVHQASLENGVKVTGATVHFVNEIPDGGEIIAQKAVYIEPGDTPETLQRRVMEQAEWILLPQAAETVCASMKEETK